MKTYEIKLEIPLGAKLLHINGAKQKDGKWFAKEGQDLMVVIAPDKGVCINQTSVHCETDIVHVYGMYIAPGYIDPSRVCFDMPRGDVTVKTYLNTEVHCMEPNETPKVIDTFPIPDELARELSDLLTRQTIRSRLMMENLNDKDKFMELENLLVPVTARIELLKSKITSEHVPDHYRFPRYSWNYDGYEIAGNVCQIIDNGA